VRDRERERDKEREGQRERHRTRQRERDGDREKERETEIEKKRQTETALIETQRDWVKRVFTLMRATTPASSRGNFSRRTYWRIFWIIDYLASPSEGKDTKEYLAPTMRLFLSEEKFSDSSKRTRTNCDGSRSGEAAREIVRSGRASPNFKMMSSCFAVTVIGRAGEYAHGTVYERKIQLSVRSVKWIVFNS
jgi:hypothetical protein